MYAVIETGGKQYRVQPGDIIRVERLAREPGEDIEFDRVLLVADGENAHIGKPHVEGGRVSARVTGHGRAPKIRVVKFRRRKNSRTRTGHRQNWTELEIRDIQA